MGACYSVRLRMKFKAGQKEKAAVQLQRLIKHETRADFSLPRHQQEGVTPDSGMEDLVRIFLAGWKETPFKLQIRSDGTEEYENVFSAGYGWERVMIEMFEALAPYLMDGSKMEICLDSSHDRLMIVGGEAV